MACAGQAAWQAVSDLTVAQSACRPPRRSISRLANPLHAVAALLHHAAAAHGDVGVVLHPQRLGFEVGVFQKIEPPHLVGAVVRAKPRADAAVVDHVVQPLGTVDGRLDRAHVFARRVFAMHAGHGLKVEFLRRLEFRL